MILPQVQKLRQGPTLTGSCVDCGAMTMDRQLHHIQALVDDAISKGARLLAGGYIRTHADVPQGQFFEPTVLDGVTPAMQIANEEVFGPVMCIMTFRTDEEAIALVNASPYGLGRMIIFFIID
jgi:benzaldehyde dehydrogenase (NAD)